METVDALLHALARAVPGVEPLRAPPEPPPQEPEAAAAWLEQWLGEEFVCRVDWDSFDAKGLAAMSRLRPIVRTGVRISLEALHAEALSDEDDEPDDLAEYFIPVVNAQLAPHQVQVVELDYFERPRLMCVTTEAEAVDALEEAVEAIGLTLVTHPVRDGAVAG